MERLLTIIQRLFDEKSQRHKGTESQDEDTIFQEIMNIYLHISSESDKKDGKDGKGWRILLLWLIVHKLGKNATESVELIDRWQLSKGIIRAIEMFGVDYQTASREMLLIRILVRNSDWFDYSSYTKAKTGMNQPDASNNIALNFKQLFEQSEVRDYLQINQYQGIWYIHKESLEDMLYWLSVVSCLHIVAEVEKQGIPASGMLSQILSKLNEVVTEYLCIAQSCSYQMEEMFNKQFSL
ncbi:MAG: hypothetical protein V1749_08055 [Candidatus Desantisbacteria bacterium]